MNVGFTGRNGPVDFRAVSEYQTLVSDEISLAC